jgi:putative endonuclease
MAKCGWLYIMANRYRGHMYVGVTADLLRRVYQHREGIGSSHVVDYAATRLVYAESHESIEAAIAREKLVKKWKRDWKFALIEADNPDWRDFWTDWFPDAEPQQKPSPVPSTGRR